MAKEEKRENTRLQEAIERQKKAERVYENLVSKNTAKMTTQEKQQHAEACRKALAEKREAQQAARDLKAGKV